MAVRKPNAIVKSCLFAVIFLAALFLSFELLPSAKAEEEICLKIALPEMADNARHAERYRAAMAEARVVCAAGLATQQTHGRFVAAW